MILKYGTTTFADGSTEVKISKRPEYSARGYRIGTRETWNVDGELIGDAATLNTLIAKLQIALSRNNQSAALLFSGGGQSVHSMNTARTRGGVRVLNLDFPDGAGAQFATFRSFSFALEALFPDLEDDLLAFEETITVSGGGPIEIYVQPRETKPIRQTVANYSVVTTTQQGSATGYSRKPSYPAPVAPALEMRHLRRRGGTSPSVDRGAGSDYRISWEYTFQSTSELDVQPNAR